MCDETKGARKDKRQYYEVTTSEAEQAEVEEAVATLYQTIRFLLWKGSTQIKSVKDGNGKSITKETDQRKNWAEHFKRLLNRPPPTTRPIIPTVEEELSVDINPSTKAKVLKALHTLKTGKAAGSDGIPEEALKMDPETSTDLMTPLL
ncbi:unnamed protein product [Trichobilharzia regenti]|nr:unnamed protein product [Trichobilharzia regenti]